MNDYVVMAGTAFPPDYCCDHQKSLIQDCDDCQQELMRAFWRAESEIA